MRGNGMGLFTETDASIWDYVRITLKIWLLELVVGIMIYIPLELTESMVYTNTALAGSILLVLVVTVGTVPGFLAYHFYEWD